jgi:DNA polymerase III subunit epsilon
MQRNKLFRDFRLLSRILDSGTVLTALDTETTGLFPDTGRIIEIGAVRFNKDGILETYNKLVNPGCTISSEVTRINHIDNTMVLSCPPIDVILPTFMDFIGDSILIAHNANFDLDFLNAELLRSNFTRLKNNAIDTLEFSRWAYPKLSKHSLQFLAQAFAIDVKHAHRAEDDARVCMEIFFQCLKATASVQKKQQLTPAELLQDQREHHSEKP